MMLADLITNLDLKKHPGERWAILGPEAEALGSSLGSVEITHRFEPSPDGLLLAGALSAAEDAAAWLQQLIDPLAAGTALVVIDWQADGPLERGPGVERRFKRGRLCRLLRESGFGQVETLDHHPDYYVVSAIKGPPPVEPHAGEYVAVAAIEELPRNGMKAVSLFGHEIIIANTGKEFVAFARGCPHADSPLEQGLLRGRNVVCRRHAYIWNVSTGEPVQPDDEDTLPRYPVIVDRENGQVLVAVAPPPPT